MGSVAHRAVLHHSLVVAEPVPVPGIIPSPTEGLSLPGIHFCDVYRMSLSGAVRELGLGAHGKGGEASKYTHGRKWCVSQRAERTWVLRAVLCRSKDH